QLPGAGGWRSHFTVHMHVDHAGPVVTDCLLEGAAQVLATRYRDAIGTAGAGPGGKIRVVGLAHVLAAVERGTELTATEHAVLDVANSGPGEVVPHHPDAGQVVFHGGTDHVRRHGEAAVAAHR